MKESGVVPKNKGCHEKYDVIVGIGKVPRG